MEKITDEQGGLDRRSFLRKAAIAAAFAAPVVLATAACGPDGGKGKGKG